MLLGFKSIKKNSLICGWKSGEFFLAYKPVRQLACSMKLYAFGMVIRHHE